MPIYEYQCPKCHNSFEEWLKHTDAEQHHPCPTCQAQAERVISNTSFVLKGGGWYVTDYGNKKNSASTDAAPCASGGDAPACASSGCSGTGCAAAS